MIDDKDRRIADLERRVADLEGTLRWVRHDTDDEDICRDIDDALAGNGGALREVEIAAARATIEAAIKAVEDTGGGEGYIYEIRALDPAAIVASLTAR